jgi:hypothetical protein
MRNHLLLYSLLAIGLAATPALADPAPGNLILNGDFEIGGTLQDGYYTMDPAGPFVAPAPDGLPFNIQYNAVIDDFGWTITENNIDLVSNRLYAVGLAKGGENHLDLIGVGSTGAISQTFTTTAGRPYEVRIDYARNLSLIDQSWAGDIKTADVLINGASIGTLNATDTWQQFKVRFTGAGAPSPFTIRQTAGGGWAGVLLDNIVVTEVPEPATWMTTIFGFGLMGAMMRNRRRVGALA